MGWCEAQMASLTLQNLQIWVRTMTIFKLEVKGKELDSWLRLTRWID